MPHCEGAEVFILGYAIALTSLFNLTVYSHDQVGLNMGWVGWWERGRRSNVGWVPTVRYLMWIIESLLHHCKEARNWFPAFVCEICSLLSQCYPSPVKHRLWIANKVSGSKGHFFSTYAYAQEGISGRNTYFCCHWVHHNFRKALCMAVLPKYYNTVVEWYVELRWLLK